MIYNQKLLDNGFTYRVYVESLIKCNKGKSIFILIYLCLKLLIHDLLLINISWYEIYNIFSSSQIIHL